MLDTFLRMFFVVFLCVMVFTIYKRVRLVNAKTPEDKSAASAPDPSNDCNG